MTPRHIPGRHKSCLPALVLLALALLGLGACGQKGALYLPDEGRAAPAAYSA